MDGWRLVMLDIVDLITTLGDILTALASWRVLLSCVFATALILVICWNISAPWDLVLSIVVGLFCLWLGLIWQRRS